MIETSYVERIALEAAVRPEQAEAAVKLFDGDATIPFIARYRKDVTGNLDETKLEKILERRNYYIELIQRKVFILETVAKQEKLTEELRQQIEACNDRTALEDLYLPYKKTKRTKATVAREKGLEPLASILWAQDEAEGPAEARAEVFVEAEKGVNSVEEALEGARFIVAEQVSTDKDVRAALRDRMAAEGYVAAHATKNTEGKKTKFEMYYDFREPAGKIPSHRYLAIQRGVKDGALRMELELDDEAAAASIVERFLTAPDTSYAPHIRAAIEDAYKRLLRPSLEKEVTNSIRERADEEAIRVFRENAQNLLLAAPAGQIPVIGVDPGLRTGCKLAVVDATGTYRESATIYPAGGEAEAAKAEEVLLDLIQRHETIAVAIGNGTGAREAASFIRPLLPKTGRDNLFCVLVSEAGASVYSASKLAREEFPDLDVTIRGAISIARRLQDPLAELVKIDPRHIGVGQYQHDVNQKQLKQGLHRTVVSCVNHVGVNLNTASAQLLSYVSGIQAGVAKHIVARREEQGAFTDRQELLSVEGVGPKTFEQCAGFLRITGGLNPLDATGIHPEAYAVCGQIAEACNVALPELIGNRAAIEGLDVTPFALGAIGRFTLQDICNELLKPGRDPRKEFRAPQFREGVETVNDLEAGMDLEGVVTNVTDFGAFVDIGVHQDGLVHLSELANRYIRDPHSVVKVGQIVKVRVIKVDKDMPRISLSIKALQPAPDATKRRRRHQSDGAEKAPSGAGAPAGERQGSTGRQHAGGNHHDGAARRSAGGKGQKRDDKRKKPQPARQKSQGHQEEGKLNTLLADQLEALKDKLDS